MRFGERLTTVSCANIFCKRSYHAIRNFNSTGAPSTDSVPQAYVWLGVYRRFARGAHRSTRSNVLLLRKHSRAFRLALGSHRELREPIDRVDNALYRVDVRSGSRRRLRIEREHRLQPRLGRFQGRPGVEQVATLRECRAALRQRARAKHQTASSPAILNRTAGRDVRLGGSDELLTHSIAIALRAACVRLRPVARRRLAGRCRRGGNYESQRSDEKRARRPTENSHTWDVPASC